MPRETTRRVPHDVKQMPAEVRKVWSTAFRRALKEAPEDNASEVAFGAVRKLFRREEDDRWVKRAEGEDPDERRDPEDLEDPEDPEAGDDPGEEEGGAGETGRSSAAKAEADPDEDPEALALEELSAMARARATLRAERKAERAAATTDAIEITDTMILDVSGARTTRDGYLAVAPRVSRTGIQTYRGSEVKRPDLDIVRVFRPESAVFNRRAMESLAHRPITLDHPRTPVDASNWRQLAVGTSDGEVLRDGNFVRVPMLLMDAAAIEAVKAGRSQLSVGYSAKLKWQPGKTADGEFYDAVQGDISANHIALVSAARGGDALRIGDGEGRRSGAGKGKQRTGPDGPRSKAMSDVTVNLDGVSIELEQKDGQILQRHLSGLTKRLTDQGSEVETLKEQLAACQAKVAASQKDASVKDGEISALKQTVADSQMTPAQTDQLINARMEVVDRATAFFGDGKYTWTGKSDAQIRRDVVTARLGDQKAKAMNDDAISGAFATITDRATQDGVSRTAQAFSQAPVAGYNDRAATAYDKRNEELQNRWKKNRKPFSATA